MLEGQELGSIYDSACVANVPLTAEYYGGEKERVGGEGRGEGRGQGIKKRRKEKQKKMRKRGIIIDNDHFCATRDGSHDVESKVWSMTYTDRRS